MPEIADVVIAGGGILGTLIAYELSLRAMRVVLLEAHALASGTSGSSFAWVNASTKDDNEAYHRFNADAVTRWRTLRERTPHLPGIHGGGSVFWTAGGNATQRSKLRRKLTRLQAWNYPATALSRAELLTLEPGLGGTHPEALLPPESEGVFFPSELWIETARVVRFMVELTRKSAADIREYLPMTGVALNAQGRVSLVRTAQGNISTRHLILAAGTRTPALLGLLPNPDQMRQLAPLKSAPGILLEVPTAAKFPALGRVLCPLDDVGLRLRPTLDGGILLGSDALDARLLTENAETVLRDAPAFLMTHATRHLPAPVSGQETGTARLCERVMPADELPIIGRLPDAEGITVAVTHSGVTLAPLIAALLAEEIFTGKLPPVLRPYSPHRFLPE